jgi:hypothetical protein
MYLGSGSAWNAYILKPTGADNIIHTSRYPDDSCLQFVERKKEVLKEILCVDLKLGVMGGPLACARENYRVPLPGICMYMHICRSECAQ